MRISAIAFGCLIAAFSASALANPVQVACNERAAVLEAHRDVLRQVPMAEGLMGDDRPALLLTSPDGTWSLLAEMQPGVLCLIAMGIAPQPVSSPKPAPAPDRPRGPPDRSI